MKEMIFPENFKEQILFSISMCSLMVLGMMTYNLFLHNMFSFLNLKHNFLKIFIAAYLLDFLIVNRLTKFLVFKFKRQWLFPIIKVSFMVICMSCFAMLIEIGFVNNFFQQYFLAIPRNYFVALILQLIIVGPFSRKLLKIYRKYN